MLRKAPFALGAFLALFGEQIELHDLLHNEPEPSPTVRALIGRVIDQQQPNATRSSPRSVPTRRRPLASAPRSSNPGVSCPTRSNRARQEREHLVSGVPRPGRPPLLQDLDLGRRGTRPSSPKRTCSSRTGSARSRPTPGIAADAQSVIDDIHHSTSWRLTAPVRLLSRMLASRATPSGPRTSPDCALVTEFDPFFDNVSVIVLNYNQAETTVECLDALAAAESDLIREIIVVDNGSSHEELAILRQRHRRSDFDLVEVGSQPVLRRGQQHRGRLRHGDYIVFLNNDAFVQPGWIEALCSTMRSDPTGGRGGTDVPVPRRPGAGGRRHHRPDGRRRADRQGSGLGPRPLRHAVPRRLLLGRLSHDAARRLPQGRRVRPRVGARLLRGHRSVPEAVDPVRQGHGEPERSGRPHREQDHVRQPAPAARHLRDQPGPIRQEMGRLARGPPDVTPGQPGPGAPARDRRTRHERISTCRSPGRPPQMSQFVLYSPYQLVPGGGERMFFELASVLSSVAGTSNVVFASPTATAPPHPPD